jgi:drug/metabolite transporter (DMT)-like permease
MEEEAQNSDRSIVTDTQSVFNVAFKYISYLNPFHFHKHGVRGKAIVALILVCFFWGTTWLASKQGVRHMPALQLAGMRQIFGGMCYVIFFLARGAAWPRGKDWIAICILAFLNFMLSNGLSTWGVQYISAGLGSIIGSIFPLWLLIIGLFASKSKMSRKAMAGLILGFMGICVIFYEHLRDFLNAEFRFGIIISLVSTWSWAFGTLYTKKHAAHFNPYFGLGLQMVISGVSLIGISHAANQAIPFTTIPWQSWAAIGYLVVFGSVISFIAYLYALQNLPTEQASLYAYINPVVAVILGSILFGEKMSTFIIIGVLITVYGVYLVNKSAVKR